MGQRVDSGMGKITDISTDEIISNPLNFRGMKLAFLSKCLDYFNNAAFLYCTIRYIWLSLNNKHVDHEKNPTCLYDINGIMPFNV